MNQLEKSVELYRLIAERCEKSVYSQNQAKVYSEMTEFISGFSSIEDATAGIKNSKYYLAPTEALIRDKIEAKIKAAVDRDMPDVADVYINKLKAIDQDQGEMYTSGYERTAQNIRNEYILTIQAFGEIFRAYLCYKIDGNESYLNEIDYNLKQLKRPSNNFVTVSEIASFRNLIDCTDGFYERFVDDIQKIISGNPSLVKHEYDGENEEDAWNSIKDNKIEIQKAGSDFQEFSSYPEVVVTGTKEGYR